MSGALSHDYDLTFEKTAIDPVAAHEFLSTSYWASNIPLDTVKRAIANSVCVAVRHGEKQVGFARVVTDKATFAYLADVYVLEEHRGQRLAFSMVKALQDHPDLQGLRRWLLATLDAHALYAELEWEPLPDPAIMMQRHFPDIYQ
ncbi:MAG: GNAT family N-acetyltransferase [Pseudomonadota bacterium]